MISSEFYFLKKLFWPHNKLYEISKARKISPLAMKKFQKGKTFFRYLHLFPPPLYHTKFNQSKLMQTKSAFQRFNPSSFLPKKSFK